MFDVGFEAGMELLALVGYGVGTVALTGLGFLAETLGVEAVVTGGVSVSALWLVAVGGVFRYTGVGYCGQELGTAVTNDTI